MAIFRRIPEHRIVQLLIILLGTILFSALNGRLHLFDWDEINFAESAREMMITGNYATVQINFLPFWEKPPLFIWMQAASMHLFGINEFAARFPNTIAGIFTLLFLFEVGRRHWGIRTGKLIVLAYGGSFLPFFYFKTGIIDPWFNLFMYGSLYALMLYTIDKAKARLVMTAGGILLGMAILTKGPAAMVIIGLSAIVYLLYQRFKVPLRAADIAIFAVATLLTGGSWFLLMAATGNQEVIADFIRYQIVLFTTEDAGHGGFLLYHFVVVFAGVFPSSLFAIAALSKRPGFSPLQRHFFIWNAIILFTVLILFTIVRTKIVHYSSMAYFPVAMMATLYIDTMVSQHKRFPNWLVRTTGVMIGLYATVLLAISLTDIWKQKIISAGLIKDPFTLGNLEAHGGWTQLEWLVSLILLSGWLIFRFYNKKLRLLSAVQSLFTAAIAFIFLAMVWIAPRVEKYTQEAVIEFCERVADENGYVNTLGHKSYAIYFYANRQPPGIPTQLNPESNLDIPENRPLYFIIKNKRKSLFLDGSATLELLYEKNGYAFVKYHNPANDQ